MAEQVIDASLAVKWVVGGEPLRDKAQQLLYDARVRNTRLIAPPLLEYEVESVLQRRLWQGRVGPATVDRSLQAFYSIGVQIIAQADLVPRARAIARQFQQERIYDALYAALAEIRGCVLWTADKAFYDSVQTGLPYVRFLATYR